MELLSHEVEASDLLLRLLTVQAPAPWSGAQIRSEGHDVDADCAAIKPSSGAAWR